MDNFVKQLIFILLSRLVFGLYVDDLCTLNDGSPGICKSNNNCQVAHDMLKSKRIIPTICGFEGFEPVLCCPTKNIEIKKNIAESSGAISERISVQKCNEYKKCAKLRNKRQIFDSEAHIQAVGGIDAVKGEYPHMAAIGWALIDGTGYLWSCGGSLISEYYVLTAAHCTHSRNDKIKSFEPIIIRLGTNDLEVTDRTMFQHIVIDRITKHPNYTAIQKYHDIALFRLKNPAIFGDYVKPICLWQTENIPNLSKPIATGWGRLGYAEDATNILQEVNLDIIDTNTCMSFYKNRRSIARGIISEQLCAGYLKGGKDTCQGDSGGPLQIYDFDCLSYNLIGITSFGIRCGGVNSPGVYTRVSSYIDWIESLVWPN